MVGGNQDESYLTAFILGAIIVAILVYATGTWDIIMFLVRRIREGLQAHGI